VLRQPALGLLLFVAFAACSGPMGLTAGEAVRGLEPAAPTLMIAVVAADDSTAVPATVSVFDSEQPTDEIGHLTIGWPQEGGPLTIGASAPGFVPGSMIVDELPEESAVTIVLTPVILSGQVLTPEGKALPGTEVRLGRGAARTGDDGLFELARAVPGELVLERPAWEPATFDWDGEEVEIQITMQPRMIRALRVGGDRAGDPVLWDSLLELADNTGINAFVIDTKDEGGTVFYDTGVTLAHEIGAVRSFYDVDQIIQDMDDRGLYKITRIVTFQDNFLAKARPEIAARDTTTGETWRNNNGVRWLDPTDRESWKYPLDLAEEACRLGFDEIQFDYVRFPSDGPISTLEFDELTVVDYYSAESQEKRIGTIAAFLSEARDRLNPMGCAVAADIFAITLESRSDEGIGQSPAPLSNSVDVLSPMIYTYTYGSGWVCENPNDCPVELVSRALDAGIPRLEGFSIYRPWLQRAFISTEEILAIQGVAEDRALGWMLWSANTQFSAEHLPPADP